MKTNQTMKTILVVGPNSYIAKVFMESLPADSYKTISVRGSDWLSYDYSIIDSIIYFSAIVHHPEIKDESLYNKVNADIPFQMAKLAKEQGVRKFIYISSVAVFGLGPVFGQINSISRNTPTIPVSLYGKSKLLGEERLLTLDGITIQIVRLPNVYGPQCPGTFYHRIEMLSGLKLFPIYKQNLKFSLISVENVSKALNNLISLDKGGVYIPQDTPILSITDRIQILAKKHGIKQKQVKIFWPMLWLANKLLPRKYTNNLYGGYLIEPKEFPTLTD